MDFESINNFGDYGFCKPVPLAYMAETNCHQVPFTQGVYVVVRGHSASPSFLDESKAGHFKGNNPTVSKDTLLRKWVEKVVVMYVGETDNLKQRLSQLIQFGAGEPVGHWGGRIMWQLTDAADLLVSWQPTPDENPSDVKKRIIQTFYARYGKLPFANLRK